MTRALASTNSLLVLAAVAVLSLTFLACDQEPEEVVPATTTPVPTQTSTPLVDGLAPEGCTAEEEVYVDPDGQFAVCYLPEMEITTQKADDGLAVTVQHPTTDSARVTATIGWTATPYIPCEQAPTVIKNQRMEKLAIDGISVDACVEDHFDIAKDEVYLYTTMDFSVQRSGKEPVLVLIAYTGDEITRSGLGAQTIADRMLDSLAIF